MLKKLEAVKIIIYANIILFLVTHILSIFGFNYLSYLAGWNLTSNNFQIYQLITYQFLHADLLHILLNMLILYSLGPFVENYFGKNRFYLYYLLCGIASYVSHFIFTKDIYTPLIGASGAVWGIIALFGFIYKNQPLNFMFIPINIKAKYLISILFLFELFSCIFVESGTTSHLAHVGGALMGGILFILDKYVNNRR